MRLNVNGKDYDMDVPNADTPLLWVLRDYLGLVGTKFGCGIAQCGACTVHVDGNAMFSCSTPAAVVEGRSITTIEGLADEDGTLHPLQQADHLLHWVALLLAGRRLGDHEQEPQREEAARHFK